MAEGSRIGLPGPEFFGNPHEMSGHGGEGAFTGNGAFPGRLSNSGGTDAIERRAPF